MPKYTITIVYKDKHPIDEGTDRARSGALLIKTALSYQFVSSDIEVNCAEYDEFKTSSPRPNNQLFILSWHFPLSQSNQPIIPGEQIKDVIRDLNIPEENTFLIQMLLIRNPNARPNTYQQAVEEAKKISRAKSYPFYYAQKKASSENIDDCLVEQFLLDSWNPNNLDELIRDIAHKTSVQSIHVSYDSLPYDPAKSRETLLKEHLRKIKKVKEDLELKAITVINTNSATNGDAQSFLATSTNAHTGSLPSVVPGLEAKIQVPSVFPESVKSFVTAVGGNYAAASDVKFQASSGAQKLTDTESEVSPAIVMSPVAGTSNVEFKFTPPKLLSYDTYTFQKYPKNNYYAIKTISIAHFPHQKDCYDIPQSQSLAPLLQSALDTSKEGARCITVEDIPYRQFDSADRMGKPYLINRRFFVFVFHTTEADQEYQADANGYRQIRFTEDCMRRARAAYQQTINDLSGFTKEKLCLPPERFLWLMTATVEDFSDELLPLEIVPGYFAPVLHQCKTSNDWLSVGANAAALKFIYGILEANQNFQKTLNPPSSFLLRDPWKIVSLENKTSHKKKHVPVPQKEFKAAIIPNNEITNITSIVKNGDYEFLKGQRGNVTVLIKKLLLNDRVTQEKFLKQMHLLLSLRSYNIVQTHGIFVEPNLAIITDYIPKTLEDRLKETDLSWKECLSIVLDITRALAELHRQGILHGNLTLKAVCLMKNPEGVIPIAQLTDFDLASDSRDMQKDIESLGKVFFEIARKKASDVNSSQGWLIEDFGKIASACLKKENLENILNQLQNMFSRLQKESGEEKHVEKPKKSWQFPDPINTVEQSVRIKASGDNLKQLVQIYMRTPVDGWELASIDLLWNQRFDAMFSHCVATLSQQDEQKPVWSNQAYAKKREAVLNQLHSYINKYEASFQDPASSKARLMHVWHGTSEAAAQSIALSGFCNVGATDPGFFGNGLYFAQHAQYAFNYAKKHKDHALFLSLVAMRSIFPLVHEDGLDLMGKANDPVSDTHIAPVSFTNLKNPNDLYAVVPQDETKATDLEVILFQLSQILPRAIFHLREIKVPRPVSRSIDPWMDRVKNIDSSIFQKIIEELQNDYRAVRIPFADIAQQLKVIDDGRGKFTFKYSAHWLGREVLVKKLPDVINHDYAETRKKFLREMNLVSKFQYPNIVQVYGICEELANLAIVTEYISLTLEEHIKTNKISWEERLSIAKDIAQGLANLQDHKVILRNLKTSNILLQKQSNGFPIAKIAGFETARIKPARDEKATSVTSIVDCFSAPELITGDYSPSHASDIFNFAMILYTLMTGELPLDMRRNGCITPSCLNDRERQVERGLQRFANQATCPPIAFELAKIIRECCKGNPTERLSAKDILHRLNLVTLSSPKKAPAKWELAESKMSLNGPLANSERFQRIAAIYKRHPINGFEIDDVKFMSSSYVMRSFEASINILEEQSKTQFLQPSWPGQAYGDARTKRLNGFMQYLQGDEQQQDQDPNYPGVKFIQGWYSTDKATAQKIIQSGFVELQSSDFGNGFLFSLDPTYAFEKAVKKHGDQHALVVATVACRSMYPILIQDGYSRRDKLNETKCDSHLVPIVDATGMPPISDDVYPDHLLVLTFQASNIYPLAAVSVKRTKTAPIPVAVVNPKESSPPAQKVLAAIPLTQNSSALFPPVSVVKAKPAAKPVDSSISSKLKKWFG